VDAPGSTHSFDQFLAEAVDLVGAHTSLSPTGGAQPSAGSGCVIDEHALRGGGDSEAKCCRAGTESVADLAPAVVVAEKLVEVPGIAGALGLPVT
jgi:hypothetical protein